MCDGEVGDNRRVLECRMTQRLAKDLFNGWSWQEKRQYLELRAKEYERRREAKERRKQG